MQRIRRVLIQRIDEIEQGLRRSSIDTRTFTRPKKRMSRPSLETMSESPLLDSKLSLSPWQRLLATHAITENIDDFSLKFDNTFPSLSSDLSNLNATFNTSHNMGLNTTYQKIASENRLSMASDPKFDVTFLKTDLEIQELNTSQKSSDSDLSTSSRKASDPCLNATFLKAPGEIIPSHQMSPRSRSITPSGLNCTFSVADNSGHRSGRAPSCDSMADDDQMSSASDSSFSSTTRLMNVGDVQNIARLQEESLKQVTSTPKRSNNRDGLTLGNGDDGLSPIKRSMQDLNHGYQSDHSDHSSAEGRVRSARSSVRSSPAGSPFGSTNALSHDCPPPSNTTIGLPRRELKLVPPSQKQPVPKPQGAVRPAESTRGRPASGLKPPATRPSGIGRPSSAGASNIPRPQSRIPAPRFRSTYSAQPTTKVDWMDGCY
ncbi:SLAIN motif-containing protein 2 isoform X2 [Anabrus simplex]